MTTRGGVAGLVLVVVLASGCGAEDDGDGAGGEEPELDSLDQEVTAVLSVDFESYPLGALRSPWVVTPASSASTASIVNASGHGKVLLLHGGSAPGDFLVASLRGVPAAAEAEMQVELRPDPGASFIMHVTGAGTPIEQRRIRLQRAPGSTTLVASTAAAGNISCGTLPSGSWSRVSLVLHTTTEPHTFDVRINGAATACTGKKTGMSSPFAGLSIMDDATPGWGGDVRFDNLKLIAL